MPLLNYRITQISPEGRNKYGNYYSKGNMTRNVVSTSYGGNATTNNIATPDTHITPTETAQFYIQIQESSVEFTTDELAMGTFKTVAFNAMRGTEYVPIMILDMDSVYQVGDTFIIPQNSGVTATPSIALTEGMTLSFPSNGTSGASIGITANSRLANYTEGTLHIPVCMYIGNGSQPVGNSVEAWWDANHQWVQEEGEEKEIITTNNIQITWVDLNWKVVQSPSEPSSVYRLSLSNDNTSIICDSEGDFVTGSTLPSTQAKVYYGSELQSAATYSITANTDVTGMTTGVTGGVLSITFDNSLQFSGGNLAITISGKVQETVVDVKTFNISKAYGGKDGTDATIYWMMLNTDSVIYNPTSGIITPNIAIKVSGYTQTGANPAQYHGASNITVDFISRRTGTGAGEEDYAVDYPDGFTPTSGTFLMYNKLRFRYYADNAHTQLKDMEDVDLLMDGTDGIDGSAGRAGAAIRGPYDWADISGDTRYYYAGEESIYEGSEKWIDVILKDGVYYYCTQSIYFDSSQEDWSYLVDYFQSGETMNFVAANLLLADNAKIKFQTGNQIYMEDSAGTITAGVYGGNGSDVAFWAGNSEANPNFSVDHNGNLIAKSGVFEGFVRVPYKKLSELPTASYTFSANTAYIISVPGDVDDKGNSYIDTQGNGWKLRLPQASADLNGFTYRIMVLPARNSSLANKTWVTFYTVDGTNIYDARTSYNQTTGNLSLKYTIDYGECVITCIPYYIGTGSNEYMWAIIDCTGEVNAV
jgi:hypothetical protein